MELGPVDHHQRDRLPALEAERRESPGEPVDSLAKPVPGDRELVALVLIAIASPRRAEVIRKASAIVAASVAEAECVDVLKGCSSSLNLLTSTRRRSYPARVLVGHVGHWWQELGGPPERRPALPGPLEVDVAIVGAGFTGLWTALYLARIDPSLRVCVLEAQFAGFGASGRNGGWVMGSFSGSPRAYARRSGQASLAALRSEMNSTVGEIERMARELEIDAGLERTGHLTVAIGPAQASRLEAHVAAARAAGAGASDLALLDRAQLAERVNIAGALGASFSAHVARVQPARLVAGLARAVERHGARIYEDTPVHSIEPGRARTARGDVHARWVVRATEGYTASLAGERRTLVPMNSSMIATTPLDSAAWEAIGWEGREVIGDEANVYIYMQRTDDDRIAIGGRGVPYRFGSRTDGDGQTAPSTIASLRAKLEVMFPVLAPVEVEHAWSGVLGVPRDWCVAIRADRATRLASAGGYVGEGVGASNLAGRTLADLVLERETERTRLPWVGRHPRRWEPEPLRWAMIRSVYELYRRADAAEARSGARPPSPGSSTAHQDACDG